MSCELATLAVLGSLALVLGRLHARKVRNPQPLAPSRSGAIESDPRPRDRREHLHTWEWTGSEERTNRRAIRIYRCLHCGELERRDEGPDAADL